jgi:ubiquinone/menaquinone biosynthesis C-methylase UbiE
LPLYRPGVRVIGLELSAATLARARRRAPRALLVQGDAEALPFRAGAFDTVVSGLVFCSVPDAPRGLIEVRRVLSAGGALRMLEHVRATRGLKARVQDRWQPAWTRLTGGCRWNRDTEAAVERAGFRIAPEGRRARGDMRRFVARPLR